MSNNIWGSAANTIWKPFTANQGEANFALLMKLPREIQIINTTTSTGFLRTLNVDFTMDEALLNRAEAEIMLGQNDAACADMNTWMHNYFNTSVTLTPSSVQAYFNSVPYAYADADKMVPSFKKHISPRFSIDAEGSVQESLLQCLLNFRRIETVHQGMRWMDIRRYNIEIPRRLIGANGKPSKNLDWLEKDDPRQTVQIHRVFVRLVLRVTLPNQLCQTQYSSTLLPTADQVSLWSISILLRPVYTLFNS